jgi:excisionase family DNA binding protein
MPGLGAAWRAGQNVIGTNRSAVDDPHTERNDREGAMNTPLTGPAPRLLTTLEAADMLTVSRCTVLRWIDAGSIPYLEMPAADGGVQYRIPLQGLLSSLASLYDIEGDLRRADAASRALGLSETTFTRSITELGRIGDRD